jgi:hypothetical protein
VCETRWTTVMLSDAQALTMKGNSERDWGRGEKSGTRGGSGDWEEG